MNNSRNAFLMCNQVPLFLFCLLLVCSCQYENKTESEPATVEWRNYASDKFSSKYSSLDQINKENVKQLTIDWKWQSPAADLVMENVIKWVFETTPLMVNEVLYASTTASQVVALHPATGETIWMYDPESSKFDGASHGTLLHRGVSYWEDGEDKRIIFGTSDAYLIALDALTGKPIESFGNKGRIDLTKGLRRPIERGHYSVSSPPAIVRDVIVVGASITDPYPTSNRPPGDVRGFDVKTGKHLWTFHSIPQEGEFGNETWENESWKTTGNTNVWTLMSADEELGYVYLPFSTPTNDWYGGHRHGDNLFAESLVCLNAQTGERIWHFQMVHHGLWDYDLPAAPNLMDIEVEGKPVKAVAQVSKQGFIYVFDRVTGEPIWPIEERPVPTSKIPGEKAAPTQPFPTRPPAFEQQGFTKADLIDFTPEIHEQALQAIESFEYGPLFTPPSLEKTLIQAPGALGGANWQGAAFDPETNILYVPSINMPGMIDLVPSDPEVSDHKYTFSYTTGLLTLPNKLPMNKPPYGRITAIDMNEGAFKWTTPMGEGPRNHPALKGLNLPRLGWPLRGSPLVTKSLLFVGQEARIWHFILPAINGLIPLDEVVEEMVKFEPKFSVYDKENGDLLHEIELPANVSGAPMTYKYKDKQYIVFAIGGFSIPGELIALSLPDSKTSEVTGKN